MRNSNAIGQAIKRLEDRPLLIGAGRFVADENRENQLYMRVVRSPIAFGRIVEIDTAEALELEGVVAVWTIDDIADLPQIDFRMTNLKGLEPYRQWCLAKDYVRYVGDPIAVVFATNPYVAEDAADLIFPDIEELPPVLSADADTTEFMPETLPGLGNEAAVVSKSYGDVDAAFAAAALVVDLDVAVGRHTGVPMETRGALAVHDAETDVITMFGAAKVPHYNRDAIARMLDLPQERVQLSEGHVGGGFGIRGELYPEDVLVCLAARRLGRPVKWVEDRKEHLLTANHSRDQQYRMRAAVDADGVITGLDVEFFSDQGGYIRTHGATVTDLSAALLPGPYQIPAYRAVGRVRLTNKTPAGTYRAPGRYESSFARERLMDFIAATIGVDRFEIRRRNLLPETSMPHSRGIRALGTDVIYDSGKYHDLLTRLEEYVKLPDLERKIAERRRKGELVGYGIGYFVEKSGLGPEDLVRIYVGGNGSIRIVTGVASIGQGVETVLAQICADTLGINTEEMEVIHGQTRLIEQGLGAFATRVTVMSGSATRLAAEALIGQALDRAAEMTETPRDQLSFLAGEIHGAQDGSIVTLGQIATASGGEMVAEGRFRSDHMTYPYGIHFAQVRLDPETSGVRIERYVVAFDVGRAINPMLVEGQIVGAVAQGIGGALYEEFVYDDVGQPLAASLADYLMPTALEVPSVEVLLREDAPSPINPLGVKGAGEGGITASGAALASAVEHAMGRAQLIDRLPMSSDRIFHWLKSAG
ncbi:xanthine dehydrogenase family protein molybdopterin-binding subunit [Defluviimonas sp. SAOS-178_SWC]|uniref:xanthine dehydrogenase family protein molybdopterin-binding subunit n=1 Tax=Defluviimonas sp. SAOS-178_SWC TaxID=3121287 RepID=UPI0032217D42